MSAKETETTTDQTALSEHDVRTARSLLQTYCEEIEQLFSIADLKTPKAMRLNFLSEHGQSLIKAEAEANGFQLDELAATFRSRYLMVKDESAIILFPAITSFDEYAYPIAHEFGHYLDHRLKDWLSSRPLVSVQLDMGKEDLADAFGRYLSDRSLSEEDRRIIERIKALFKAKRIDP